MSAIDDDSLLTYQQRLLARRGRAAALANRDRWLSHLRVACFVGLGVAVVAAWRAPDVSWVWASSFAVAFVGLVIFHQRVATAYAEAMRRVGHYERGLARMACRVPDDAARGPAVDPQHPYAGDLDLFGERALFGLLCTAHTAAGEGLLADWLLRPASHDVIVTRQATVRALRGCLDLREDLTGLTAPMRHAVHPEALVRWATAAKTLPRFGQLALCVCNVAFCASATFWLMGQVAPGVVLSTIVVQSLVARLLQYRVEGVMAALEQPSRELPMLAQVIRRLQNETVETPHWQQLRNCLMADEQSAAQRIARLDLLTRLYDAHKNQLFAIIAWLLLWAPHFAYFVERWRQRHGPRVHAWLQAVGEMEALLAIAGYSFEHPADMFPTITPESQPHAPVLAGEQLAHPLLPPAQAIANDVHLDAAAPLLIVSGSNMSGKSTFLRTVGVNVVLALAGAPVRAKALRVSPMHVGATLRVQDSLHTGTSRFYAEVQRLRQLLDLTQESLPLLFLIDEVLHGTNSHDRALGATAILRSFLARGAVGLVTTHDLALTQQAASLGGRNVHFVDDLVDGKLHFDYRMRPGVVQKSNALELMRAVGLY